MNPENTNNNRLTGQKGEELAIQFLEKKQYKILDQNFVSGKYEIDLICEFQDKLIFIEVKTRHNAKIEPEFAVNRSKQLHISRAAEGYMRFKKINKEIRFDIIAINHANGITEITHFVDAFYPVYYK
jgi:putative endonuclease